MTNLLERPATTEYPQEAVPVKNRRPLKIAAATIAFAAVVTGLTWGGIAWSNNIAAERAHTEAVALQHQVESAKPALEAQTAAVGAEADTTSADEVVAAEQAREAAELAAQQAAAQAAAAKAVHHNTAIGGGNAPAGTVIPMHLDTDPNSGSYGQMVIENPDQFCASNGGTTRSDGVAVCS